MRARSKRRTHGTPTTYAGVTFRSRLESEWARRFDLLGVAWNYEPVRIRLTATGDNYTPDFGLPAYRTVVEVKPREPYEVEFERAAEAAGILGGGVYFLCGSPRAANFWGVRNMGEGWYFVPVAAADLPFPTEFPGNVVGGVVSDRVNPCEERVMSAWTMTANKSGGGGQGFEKAPPGNHPARLVAIVDMGTQWQEGYQGAEGKYQHRAFFVWELVNAKQSGSSRNHVIGIDLTFSLNEKAKLRAWIGAQRGKPLADGEPFSLDTWLGHACLLNVIEKNGYPKIDGVSGVPAGFNVPEPQNPPLAWKIDAAAKSGKIDLPVWLPYFYGKPIGDTIREAQELEGKAVEVVNGTTSAASSGGVASNPQTPAAGSPPPRRPRDAAPAAEPEFFVDADGYDDKRTYKLSELRAAIEGKTGVDIANVFVVKPGSQDWAPLPVAVPESKSWLPF